MANILTFPRFRVAKSFITSSFLLFTVFVRSQEPVDLGLRDLGPVEWLIPGTYPLKITISNFDPEFDGIYNFTLNWQIDGGEIHSEYIDEFLNYPDYIPGGFIIYGDIAIPDEQLEFNQSGDYTLSVWVTNPNGFADQNPADNSIETIVHVVDYLPEKQEHLYFGSHQECFPCGGIGESTLQTIDNVYGEDVHVTRIHAFIGSDVFAYPQSETLNNLYVWDYTGHPAFVHDLYRFPIDNYAFIAYNIGDYDAIAYRLEFKSPVEVTVEDVEINTETGEYSGEIHAKFYANYSGALSVNALITEDSLMAYQNGYPDGIMNHMDILRDMTGGITGDPTIIPFYANEGLTYVYPFSGTFDPSWDISNLEFTGLVQVYNPLDSLEAEILNSERKSVEEILNPTSLEESTIEHKCLIYPNPAESFVQIVTSLEGDVRIKIVDISGKVVQDKKHVSSISGMYSLDIRTLNSGVYAVILENGISSLTQRIEIIR